MSVYIKGMEMPTSCYDCPMTNDGFYLCKATSPYRELEDDCEECKPQWCPLVTVPEHGRLIDADAAKELMKPVDSIREREPEWTWGELYEIYCKELDSLPTIVPADPAEEGEG